MDVTRAIRARALTACYGPVVALDHVDLDVEAGTLHGLVGPNGAGKSTLMALLLGLGRPTSGSLEVLGRRHAGGAATPDVAGFVDGPGLYPSLTARRNLLAVGALRGQGRRAVDLAERALHDVGLTDVADDRVGGFSLGMRQRLGLAAALVCEPRLLVLDEPANGLDPAGSRHVHRVLRRLVDDGATVVLSSHRMDDVAALCEEVTLLSTGRVVFSGPVAKLAAEGGALDHRLVTSDDGRAALVAATVPGVRVRGDRGDGGSLVVTGDQEALDHLVLRLGAEGVAVRELRALVAPLEAAFLALTGDEQDRVA